MKCVTFLDGISFRPEDVHGVLMRIRSAWLRYRLSKQANGYGLCSELRVKYPPVPVAPCPLGRYDCSACSARVSRVPIYDDGEKVIKVTAYDLPDYLCQCALTCEMCR